MKPVPTRVVLAVVSACVATLLSGEASGQTVGTASLKGRVLDGEGDGLPGVVLVVTNPSAPIGSQSAVTDVEGNYQFRLLPPGRGYTVTASIPGYATVVAGPFELHPARTTVQDLVLRPSSELEETIQVEARGNVVDVTSTKTSTTYNAEFIEGIPLLGRQFTDLLALAPGVTDASGDGRYNVRGARDTGFQLRLDGTNVTDPVSGYFGQEINLDSIEEVEVITAGASAEYGRADGGFANVITKSGGNDLSGSARFFFRSHFLDNDGANNNDLNQYHQGVPQFRDLEASLTLGGPLIQDHLWYFTSLERIDHELPLVYASGWSTVQTFTGWRAFGKVTWQVDTDNKLALQINFDPHEQDKNYADPTIAPESDYIYRFGGPLPQLKWTSVLSPQLLLETLVSHFAGSVAIQPVSNEFRPTRLETVTNDQEKVLLKLPCETRNCIGEDRFFKTDVNGSTTGPFPVRTDENRDRTTFRADLSYSIEDVLGSHAIKSGFEFDAESFRGRPVLNPRIVDNTCSSSQNPECVRAVGEKQEPLPEFVRLGTISITFWDPLQFLESAKGFVASGYLQESWKPLPNLTLNAGLRYDHEEMDSRGITEFFPLPESREMLRRFDILCDASNNDCAKLRKPGRVEMFRLTNIIDPPDGHPALQFDDNGDGIIDGAEFGVVREHMTRPQDLRGTGIRIANGNLAPRFSVSWDPLGDGRTKIFGTWNRYYDRLLLSYLAREQSSESSTAVWSLTGVANQAEPGELSEAVSDSTTLLQLDHDLKTPSTIEWSAGIERELAPEWSVSFTYIQRRAHDLLQDIDVNHITCSEFDSTYGVDPMKVCGDGGRLEEDQFGRRVLDDDGRLITVSNEAVDLYVLNPFFNQVLRLGNYNDSRYTSADVLLRKRLHRNWQMHLSYTLSRASGDAEGATEFAGNDPATSDKVPGFLDYDQRHQLKWSAVAHLPHEIVLGSSIQWASGFPFSVTARVGGDTDDAGNTTVARVSFPTGRKNDQRNPGYWLVDARLEKRIPAGRTYLTAFLTVENLLDEDYLRIRALDVGQRNTLIGYRGFGRHWEVGVSAQF